jgi:hypothetical protein
MRQQTLLPCSIQHAHVVGNRIVKVVEDTVEAKFLECVFLELLKTDLLDCTGITTVYKIVGPCLNVVPWSWCTQSLSAPIASLYCILNLHVLHFHESASYRYL